MIQHRKSDRERDRLVGPVQMLREQHWNISEQSHTEEAVSGFTTTFYRLDGKKYKQISCSPSGDCPTTHFLHDAKGRIIKHAHELGDGSQHDWITYKYDPEEKTVEVSFFFFIEYALSHRVVFSFPTTDLYVGDVLDTLYELEMPEWTGSAFYNTNGALTTRQTAINDRAAGRREVTTYLIERSPRHKHLHRAKDRYIYDSTGNLIEDTLHGADGAFISRYVREYDSMGNRIMFGQYSSGGMYNTETYYSYEFDSIGNWVTCTMRGEHDNPCVRRSITYYQGEND